MRPLHEGEARHEASEVRARGIVIFAVGLVTLGVVVLLRSRSCVMEHYAKREWDERASMLPLLATPVDFPGPHLQADPAAERLKVQERAARTTERLWLGRSESGNRTHPDRTGNGYPRQHRDSRDQGAPPGGRDPAGEARIENHPTSETRTFQVRSEDEPHEAFSLPFCYRHCPRLLGPGYARAQAAGGVLAGPGGVRSEARRQVPLDLRFRDDQGRDVRCEITSVEGP